VTFVFAQARSSIPYADAKPVFDALRSDLLPVVFRDKSPAQRESMWPAWVAQRDADIRARVAAGDEDSVINLLLYGTSFTRRPRPTERQIADLVIPRHPVAQDPVRLAAAVGLRPRIARRVALPGPGSARGV